MNSPTLKPLDPCYPRPQLRRREWTSLDGDWDFAIDKEARWTRPDQVGWNARIRVPFAPETSLSGIGDTGYYCSVWYRRTVRRPALRKGERVILHFGAVDHLARVWADGALVAEHRGGYTPFEADLTDAFEAREEVTVVVLAGDDPHDLRKPRGKQDWQLEPHSIWYPRTTGIWQTVWLERVPETRISHLRWTPNVERWEVSLDLRLHGPLRDRVRLRVRLTVADKVIAEDVYAAIGGEVHRRLIFSDPGIEDYRNELLWSPERPTIIRAALTVEDEGGLVIDEVESYTALRSVSIQGDRFVLNGRPCLLRMVLDQGYWLEGGLTAPTVDALRLDVELTKAMGFNGVRKHQKIEDPRYLFFADTLGLLVWSEMPSAYRFSRRSIERLTREWLEAVERDASHPCVVAWVPMNESWGVPDLPDSPAQRHCVKALYHLTRTYDPTRPVIGNDGWESVATDIIGIHDYDDDPQRMAKRYGADRPVRSLFERERPGGRLLLVDGQGHAGEPIMLTEFGGIAYAPERPAAWGYSRVETAQGFARRYRELLEIVRGIPLFAGFCYTQFADTYQESNGLLYADRSPKIPLEEILRATAGPLARASHEAGEAEWRERLMKSIRCVHQVPDEDHRTQQGG